MARSAPECDDDFEHVQLDDHDLPRPDAVALVPLYSIGMATPYRWIKVCQGCYHDWRADNPTTRHYELTLVHRRSRS